MNSDVKYHELNRKRIDIWIFHFFIGFKELVTFFLLQLFHENTQFIVTEIKLLFLMNFFESLFHRFGHILSNEIAIMKRTMTLETFELFNYWTLWNDRRIENVSQIFHFFRTFLPHWNRKAEKFHSLQSVYLFFIFILYSIMQAILVMRNRWPCDGLLSLIKSFCWSFVIIIGEWSLKMLELNLPWCFM